MDYLKLFLFNEFVDTSCSEYTEFLISEEFEEFADKFINDYQDLKMIDLLEVFERKLSFKVLYDNSFNKLLGCSESALGGNYTIM